jgi:hypothetical protein
MPPSFLHPLALVPLAACLSAAACVGAEPVAPPPTTLQLPAAPPTVATEPRAPVPPPDPLADLRARGNLHGEPIHVEATADSPEQWIAFLGAPSVARAAWRVVAGHPPAPVDGWPAGMKVLESRQVANVVYVLVETLAVVGQPAGLRAAWPIAVARNPGPRIGWSDPPGPSLALAGMRDLVGLEARLATPGDDRGAQVRVAAGKSLAALEAALSPRGVDHGFVWQGAFIEPRGHFDAAGFARRPEASRVRASLGPSSSIDFWFGGQGDGPQVHTATEGGREVIDLFVEPAPTASRVETARHVVAGHPVSPESLALLREQEADEPAPIAEAPWGEHGTVSVAAFPSRQTVAVLFHDGDYVSVHRVLTDHTVPRRVWADRFQAAFADLDGDGRTDVVLRGETGARSHTWAVLTPGVLPTPSSGLLTDDASDAWALPEKTVDQAVQALLKMPARAAAVAEMTRLLSRSARMPDRVLTFVESKATEAIEEAPPAQRAAWWRQRSGCRAQGMECEVWCDPVRPVCQSALHSGGTVIPYQTAFYWPVWSGGRVRLFAAAFATDGSGEVF